MQSLPVQQGFLALSVVMAIVVAPPRRVLNCFFVSYMIGWKWNGYHRLINHVSLSHHLVAGLPMYNATSKS